MIVEKAVHSFVLAVGRMLILFFVIHGNAAFALAPNRIALEAAHFRIIIDSNGQNVGFTDLATGTDYLDKQAKSFFARVQTSGATLNVTRAVLSQKRLNLEFGDSKIKAGLKIETNSTHITITVESLEGPTVESFTFLNLPLRLQASPDEPFGACALALTLNTRIQALPARQRHLQASCEAKFGIIGAKAAIVAAPTLHLLPALQNTLVKDSTLPVCKVAGPWANAILFNHGSYLFNYGDLTETNVDKWITKVRQFGFNQIDNHGGSPEFFRFGDMELNEKKWPDGWESQRRIVNRLKQAGIQSILHTYAFFIDKQSKYVTPVPDRRLDAFRVFSLAEPVSAITTNLSVNEPTAGIATTTGFFEQNSVILQIDDELITFTEVSQQAPWTFSGVKRGAFGTRPAKHARGAKARHLKECFGLLVPDVNSSLFEEIAARHAEVVNHCGFDGIYLDAIDGSAILRGPDECWYWADKFIVEIQKRLHRPVGMEMSAMWHHSWQYRSRGRAWDYPRRGQKRFIDIHAEKENDGLMLPPHLGWWAFHTYAPPQVEPSYPDVIEHLGARMIGWDAGISLTTELDEQALRVTPLFRRAANTLQICERLRHTKAFDELAKAKLRDPQFEFTLGQNAVGQPAFYPTRSHSRTISLGEPWTLAWCVTNTFGTQPARLRLESLSTVGADSLNNRTTITDFSEDSIGKWQVETARGVAGRLEPPRTAGTDLGFIIATNQGRLPRSASWMKALKRFTEPINLEKRQAIQVEIEGDGSGALLAIRLESPRHIAHGAIADRYVVLDFTGRQRFDLIETESERWSDYQWDDQKHIYHAYRELVDFGAIESICVWLQNLPPHREVQVSIGPIYAVELRSTVLRNPEIHISGKLIQFPINLPSGGWIEANGPDDCVAYGPKGEFLNTIKPLGEWPEIRHGENKLEFRCQSDKGANARAKVVLFSRGEAIESFIPGR